MNAVNALQRIIYGKPLGAQDFTVLGATDGLTAEDARIWRSYVSLAPMPVHDVEASQAIGVFTGPDGHYLLARGHIQDSDLARPVYEYVLLNRADVQAMSGNIRLMVDLVDEPIPTAEAPIGSITPLPLPTLPTWTIEKRLVAISSLISRFGQDDMQVALSLLGAALHERGLLIRGFSADISERIDLVQGLLLLLPAPARPYITFATNVRDPDTARPRIVFYDGAHEVEAAPEAGRWVADFATEHYPRLDEIRSPYIECLENLWQGDLREFISELRSLELMATRLSTDHDLIDSLNAIARRYLIDQCIMNGEPVPVDEIKTILTGEHPPQGDLRRRYLMRLLDHALEIRDSEAALIITRAMDESPELDEALNTYMNEALQNYPDAVYFVIRARLSQGVDERWLPRLRTAAMASLQVAITDSDSGTVTNWLRLIAREPVEYQLQEVLREGIHIAQPRAHTEGDLGFQLIQFVVRRVPDSIDRLLDDEALVNALPEAAVEAFRDYDPEAVLSLHGKGRELFLVALGRAATAGANAVFNSEALTQFWAIYTDGNTGLPERYQPETLVRLLLSEGLAWLDDNALVSLLTLVLSNGEDDLFLMTVPLLVDERMALLPAALHFSERPPADIINLIRQALTAENMSLQQALNTYLQLLVDKDWAASALPLAEQIARIMQQNTALTVESSLAWKLLTMASDTRSEQVSRVMLRRVFGDIEKTENERQLVDRLLDAIEKIMWSSSLRQIVLNWWRDFVRTLPQAQLQQVERALENRKRGHISVDEELTIVQTIVALRKVLGKRSLEDFADAVNTAYNVLQALSEAFDPQSKQQPISFDQSTVRIELEARQEELTPDEQRVLAKNLRELGSVIATMAENRSRASLIRREEDIDRQLMSGDKGPQSAIDAMKWLSGYLEGAQGDEDGGN